MSLNTGPVVQRHPRPAGAAAAAAAPGHAPADRPRRPGAAVPDGADQAGGHRPTVIDIPGRGPRRLQAVAADPALPGPTPGEGARHARAYLLQVRGRQPGREAQAQHRRPAGLLQQGEGIKRLATETGAGQWGSALAFACTHLRPRLQGLHGQGRYEQKPYRRSMMQTWGATRAQPVARDQRRPAGARRGPGLARDPRHRDLRGGRGRRHPARHALLLGQRAEPRLLHQTVIGLEAKKQMELAGEATRTSSSAASAAGGTSAGLPSRSCADKLSGRIEPVIIGPSSRPPARP